MAAPSAPPAAPFRTVRAETCPSGGCEVACNAGEVLVSAYCLKAGTPVYGAESKPGASCPPEAAGMVGF
ncbi:hypothetical protein, partial [Escherichia coli]